VDVALTEEESAALQQALRSYLSELRSEISQTDNARFRATLKHEREVLESVVTKLDAVYPEPTGNDVILVHLWWTSRH
jgi:hypothetical protein